MAVNEQTQEVVASEIEGHYVDFKRAVIKRYTATERDKKAFLKAAAFVIENSLDPCVFVHAMTEDGSIEKYQAPWLHAYNALDKYNAYKQKYITEIEVGSLYEHYNQYLMRLIVLGKDYRKILASPHHDLPAWYRIAVTTEPDEDIIRQYVEQARKEMKANPKIEQFILEEPTLTKSLERFEYGRQFKSV